MKYNSRIHEPAPRAITPAGRKEKDTYMLEILPNGEKNLVKTGTMNIQSEIDSHVDLCDVKKIIERFTLSGDADRLAAKPGFVDLTQMPKNLAETLEVVKRGKSLFDDLKPEIKQNFGSYEDFLSNFANAGTAMAFMEQYARPKKEVKEEAVDAETEQK